MANLTAYLAGEAAYERLSLKRDEIVDRAVPRLWNVSLEGTEHRIVRRSAPPSTPPTGA